MISIQNLEIAKVKVAEIEEVARILRPEIESHTKGHDANTVVRALLGIAKEMLPPDQARIRLRSAHVQK